MEKHFFAFALCAMLSLLVAGPAHASDGVYVVQPGDTMLHIAARHDLTATQLATANGLRWNAWVYVGQRLKIPVADSASSASGTYVVRPGDTLDVLLR